jgi:hypothetical protein
MRKILILWVLVAVSCNSGADMTPYDPNATTTTTLLNKIIETDDDGNELTTEFNYDGYKIVNFIQSDGNTGVFTYSGNIIREIKYYEGTTLVQTDLFTNNAMGQITSHTMQLHEEDYATREDFTHNADGTVSYTSWSGTVESQTSPELPGKLFFSSGEVIKKETYIGSSLSSQEFFAYDDKHNPHRNIIGLNQAFIYQGEIGGVFRNLLTTSGTTNPISVEYQYSIAGFPETSQSTTALEGGIYTQYFYE